MEGDRVSSFNHFFAVFVAVIMFNFLIYLILRQYFFKMTFLSFGLATCMIQCNISFHVSDCCSPSCLCQSVSELIQPTIFIETSIERLNEFDLCLHFLNTIERLFKF